MKNLDFLPQKPGVYLMKNKEGVIIYVGKASSLRDRVKSYFHESAKYSSKVNALVSNIANIDYIITKSELDALIMESGLIKKYRPKYNVMYKDDKAYPFLKLTVQENFPRLYITRRILPDGAKYFGPYVIGSVRNMLKTLYKLYPLRDCSLAMDKSAKRACIKEQMKMCAAPCIGKITKEKYNNLVEKVIGFLEGKQYEQLNLLTKKMKKASANLEYEEAAKFRDLIEVVKLLISQSEHKVSLSKFAKEERRKQLLIQAADELRKSLNLDKVPEYIEAFDISNLSGSESVGSSAVFKFGEPEKSEYRRYKIKTVKGINDVAMMAEIVRRRYAKITGENQILPDLILIDGGKGQLEKARAELEKLNLEKLPVAALAKKNEEIFLPGKINPVILPKDSAALHLLQHIRDEAHRFALSYHKKLRAKTMKISCLNSISFIGEKRKKMLLQYFGSIAALKGASVENIKKVPGFSLKLAVEIYNYFHERNKTAS